jgi:3-dehydroquinate synthase
MIIQSRVKSYECRIVPGLLDHQEKIRERLGKGRPFYLVDEAVYTLFKGPLKKLAGDDFLLRIKADERNKDYLALARVYRALIAKGFTRRDVLVTIGGGVLQDISGFVASTIYRGARWILIPTTLLAQADSCIGSKTSINLDTSKNLIGTFYPPDDILIDPAFLATLSDSAFRSGMGEIIKFHILSDRRRYAFLKKILAVKGLRQSPFMRKAILSTLEIKRSYFERDEFDTGVRNLLNYGHCFGHALESATDFKVAHGEAVVVGMAFANLLAVRRGIMPRKTEEELAGLFGPYFPVFDLRKVSGALIAKYMRRDKKRVTCELTIIMGAGVGDFKKYDDVTDKEVLETFAELQRKVPGKESLA